MAIPAKTVNMIPNTRGNQRCCARLSSSVRMLASERSGSSAKISFRTTGITSAGFPRARTRTVPEPDDAGILRVGNVDDRIRLRIVWPLAAGPLPDVRRDADDRRPGVLGRVRVVFIEPDPLADGVRVSEVFGGEALIDHDHLAARGALARHRTCGREEG